MAAHYLSLSRARITYLHDLIMAAASFPAALYIRTGQDFSFYTRDYLLEGTIVFTLIAAITFRWSRMYRGIWRYASIDDLLAITKAVTITVLAFLPLLFLMTRLDLFPRSVPLIHWFLLLSMLGGPRFLYRILKDRRFDRIAAAVRHRRIPVLLIGAGDEAELFLRELKRDRDAMYTVVGIVDEKGSRVGRDIHGVAVIGGLDRLQELINGDALTAPPEKLIITKDRLDGALVGTVMEVASANGLTVSRLPRLSELKAGEGATEVRPIAVEDLLGRPQVPLDREAIRKIIKGRRVLVTGAGGTIGSELTRQIVAQNPAAIGLLDISEFLLYEIDSEIAAIGPEIERETILGDVKDRDRIESAFADFRPDIVFHAAALKHVPMVEANPMEGILTNVVGTRVVADACRAAQVGCMVQISTDKAVNPTNLMGATKRLAEAYIQAQDMKNNGNGTRFVAVRFGNVLGSTGSVVPLFQRQLSQGGPLTVTHPEMTRYFMTVKEAVELVLQSATAALDDAQTKGKIFVLDMGDPVRIVDLARQMIRMAGLRPDEDIRIDFVGLRPGEKLFEELLHSDETIVASGYPGLKLAAPRAGELEALVASLNDLEDSARSRNRSAALDRIVELVPEYKPDIGIASIIADGKNTQT
ncbi:MAG: nucleoside-diphosphate sugar epimerase/dehydratase [Alphaproteobacteria bacterium]